MPAQTFHTLIARNKRNSVILIGGFVIFFVGLGLIIGTVWGGDWRFGAIVALITGMVAFFLTLASYYKGANTILSLSRARQIHHADDPQLFNVVDEMALAGGVPPPKIYLIDDTAPNAFATGRNSRHGVVAITTGLRQKLNRDELQAVMAHEVSHIRNSDILFAMLMTVMVGVAVMLADIFLRSLWFGAGRGGRRRGRSSSRGGNPAQLILLLVAIVLAILTPILARIIQMAMSRQREYLADASAVDLTRNPEGLVSALQKLTDDKEVLEVASRATAHLYFVHPIKKFEKRASGVFDTHPPLAERIKRLRGLAL